MTLSEPEIFVRSREDLIYLLSEAAEIEHNLMCCYLYAAFGLKTRDDGLTETDAAMVADWYRAIMSVAIEEMSHLSIVNNLLMAIGGAPHFGRPNFPVDPGYHPADFVVQLHRFERATIDHFIFLERPEGLELPDGASFHPAIDPSFHRETPIRGVMPSAQDYQTVGHFYRGIRHGFDVLSNRIGEAALFVGDPVLQVGPDMTNLPGLAVVTDLASADAAIDVIVDQGEGSQVDSETSHYRRFLAIRDQYDARIAEDPDFQPSRPVATNPVMRRPIDPIGHTYVDCPATAPVMDLANAIYAAMLRALAQGFDETDPGRKRSLLEAAAQTMTALTPVARHLTTLPAHADDSGINAGMSFAMLRAASALPNGEAGVGIVAERYRELADAARQIDTPGPVCRNAAEALSDIADRLEGKVPHAAKDEIETAEGKAVTIRFNGRRCIHARFCVLGQPNVFKANVDGPWLAPDEATSAEDLVAVSEACPSGAIQYTRHDGGPEERPPQVNQIRLRENGPLAVRAALSLDGEEIGFRATLCRCGRSRNKPFCDNSHIEAGFTATGEPATAEGATLDVRDGTLAVRPQKNGPYMVNGNVEVLSGTGRRVTTERALVLCRCGGSSNKPFCDGTHIRIGFKS